MKKYNVFFFGARDYYEVALALKEKNLLNYLITDFYCPDFLRKILKKRYCENIASNKVISILIDPYRETADINEKNNVWNIKLEPSKFDVFKSKSNNVRGQSSGKNPMQK